MSATAQTHVPQPVHDAADTDLPEGWALPSVADVLTVNYGRGLKQADRKPGQVGVFGSNGVVGEHNAALSGGPTIIIGRKGTIGAIHFSPHGCWPIDTTYFIDDFHGFDPLYVTHALRSLNLNALDTSTAVPGLNRNDIYAQVIPLAPLSEQKRIVARIEELFTQLNAARDRLVKVPRILKRFRQSVLAAACSGRLTDAWREEVHRYEEWPTVSLGKTLQSLDQGWSPNCEIEASPSAELWGVIKTTAVQALKFIEGENKRLPDALTPRPKLELRKGDLLITRAGPRARAGVCCLVRTVRPRLMACDKVYRFRTDESLALPQYLELALNTPSTVEEIEKLKTGISDSGVNLTQEKFRALEISLPSLAEQHEIVLRVEALFELANTIEKRVEAATKRADKLTQAILAKAFRGELVPTEAELARREGRTYEPASALLERIRREREAKSENKTVPSPRNKTKPSQRVREPREAHYARS
jgi:type I restriction enzyme S subunit